MRLLFRLVYYPKITFQTWRLGSRLGGGLLVKRESGSSGRPAAPFWRGETHRRHKHCEDEEGGNYADDQLHDDGDGDEDGGEDNADD